VSKFPLVDHVRGILKNCNGLAVRHVVEMEEEITRLEQKVERLEKVLKEIETSLYKGFIFEEMARGRIKQELETEEKK
jgi:hypothetical protein